MTPLLLLIALQSAPVPSRYDACIALVQKDPAAAARQADGWRLVGGGVPALQCLGLALAAQESWAPAEAAFAQAANDAQIAHDGRAAALWAQAGNAALAGGDPAKAREALNRSLALPGQNSVLRGEAYLDRARAAVALNDLPAARGDLDAALRLVAADPMAWLLSAALARRQHDAARAGKDVAEAARLAPGDPAIADEQARVAAMEAPAR